MFLSLAAWHSRDRRPGRNPPLPLEKHSLNIIILFHSISPFIIWEEGRGL